MGLVCGKCGSAGLYRDDDFQVGDFAIVCPICGNRYYPSAGQLSAGVAPVTSKAEGKPAAATVSGHFEQERSANIVTGPGRSGSRITEEEEEIMSKTRPCANCKREMSIVGKGLCFTCYRADRGLVGEEREAALAAIKERVESGGLKSAGNRSGRRKTAPADPAIATPGGKPPRQPVVDMDGWKPVKRFDRLTLADMDAPREIPVIIKLMIEVGIRLVGVAG